MNPISSKKTRTFALGLLGLAVAGSASADLLPGFVHSGSQAVYGFLRDGVESVHGRYAKYGLQDLSSTDFPAFGNFRWKVGEAQLSAGFGMAYRTHRHLLAQKDGEGKRTDGLDAKRKLSSYTLEKDDHGGRGDAGLLIGAVKTDQIHRASYTSQASYFEDLWSVVRARLEGKDRSALTVALRSRDGSRIRPIFLYAAQGDGEYFTCRFYDPQIQFVSRAGKVSQVAGSASKADDGRFHQLRFKVDSSGGIEIARSWIDEVENGSDFAEGSGAWVPFDWHNFYTVDFNGHDYWEYSELGSINPLNGVRKILHSLENAAENAGGHWTDIQQAGFEFGTFDAAAENPGAPAPEAD